MSPERFVKGESERTLSNALTALRCSCFRHRICSARSANNAGLRKRRQFEAESHLFRPLLTELHVFR